MNEIVLFIHSIGTSPQLWTGVSSESIGGRVAVCPANLGYPPHEPLARGSSVTIADESVHLRYETQLLMTLRGERGPLARRIVEALHRTLLSVSARVVYHDHKRVLAHVGYTPRSFREDCEAIYRMVMHSRPYKPRVRDSRGTTTS